MRPNSAEFGLGSGRMKVGERKEKGFKAQGYLNLVLMLSYL